MAGCLPHVAKRHAGVNGGDERVPKCVRPDRLVDPSSAGESSDDPPGRVPVQSFAVVAAEDRALRPLADGEVDRPGGSRCERDGDDLAALAQDGQSAVAALEPRAGMSKPSASDQRRAVR